MERSPDITDLLAHADWVRGLARELVRDEHRADDVAQDTWVEAMRGPPKDSSNVRGWLGKVVRNLARSRGRADVRRIKREVQSARSEAVPPEHELAERARLQHELSEHVLALDQPYRTVLLLRYFEGLPPRAIAARLGVPVATVRTREARAIERLRERLTRARGGAEEWTRELSALVAGLARATTAGSIATGGFWMSAQAKLWSVVAGVVLSLTALWWIERDETVELAARKSDSHTTAKLAEDPLAESRPNAERTALAPPSTAQLASATADRPARGEPGIVLDTHGRPVPDAIVVQVPADVALFKRGISPEGVHRRFGRQWYEPGSSGEAQLRSEIALLDDARLRVPVDAQGRFELARNDEKPTRAVVWQPGWANVAAGIRVNDSGVTERVLVIERTVSLSGEIVERSGAGIANAWVNPLISLQAVGTFRSTLQDVEDRPPDITEFADAAGRFTLIGLPRAAGVRLRAQAEGFHDGLSPPLADDFASSVRIVLNRISNMVDVEGRVVDARGEGLEEATVYFLSSHALTDARGSFRMRINPDSPRLAPRTSAGADPALYALAAVYPGLQPAIIADFADTIGDPVARTGLVLRLDKPALAITGTVIDDEGRPRPGVEIVLADPTRIGFTSVTTEVQARQTQTNWVGASQLFTDQEGRFEVAGLSSREYSIAAFDTERFVAVQVGPIPAGTRDIVLRESASARHENVRGRVVTRTGRPVRGVNVSIDLRLQPSNESSYSRDILSTRSDSEGRFEFARIPKGLASLLVSGEGIDSNRVPVTEYVPESEWRITVPTKARFRVETPTQGGAKSIGLLDANGKELKIQALGVSKGGITYERMPVAVASTSVCSADDEAVTLVVYGEKAEIHRMPIRLDADELTVLRP